MNGRTETRIRARGSVLLPGPARLDQPSSPQAACALPLIHH